MTSTSATLGSMPVASDPLSYGQLWRRVPRELGFLLLGYPIAIVGFAVTVALVSAGAGTLVTFFIGVFLVIAALYVSRGFATVETTRLRWTGQPAIPKPEWQDARAREGLWGWLRSVFGNGHYWLALLHTMVVNFIMASISWTITFAWTVTALGSLTYGLWFWWLPPQHSGLVNLIFRLPDTGYDLPNVLLNLLIGLVLAALLPFVTRSLTLAHWGIARLMLAPFRTDALRREIISLTASRAAASSAEGQSLRKLERDLHDGPQQRLVRLQLDIATAQRQLDSDPTKAGELLDSAMDQAKDALEELRALSRGFAPPLLLDRGLVAALESLATRSAVPATLVNDVPSGTVLPQELERNAYFVASELVTNAAKHSGATTVEVRLELPASDQLELTVTDNGHGGAALSDGHGLAGLEERVRGLGGTLAVASPAGGPTVVTAHLPIALG